MHSMHLQYSYSLLQTDFDQFGVHAHGFAIETGKERNT